MLHRLAELDAQVRQAYAEFDYKRIFAALNQFMTVDLSAFYFDIRKDALYCDPYSSVTRKAALTVIDELFRCTVTWLAPMLCFTAEEAWLSRYPRRGVLGASRAVPRAAGDLARRCAGREMAQGAHRAPRRHRRARSRARRQAHRLLARGSARSSMCPIRSCSPRWSMSTLRKLSITSAATLVEGEGPAEAFRLDEVAGRRGGAEPRRGHASARARGRSRPPSAPIRTTPT